MQPNNNYLSNFYGDTSRAFGNNNNNQPNFHVNNMVEPSQFLNNNNSTSNQNNAQTARAIDELRSVNEILPRYRGIFESYPCFNIIQSRVFDLVLYLDESVVVSAPTGSGKTAIFELAIVRFLTLLENCGQEQQIPYKIVYVAPMKALCEERFVDWHRKFANFGLTCLSVTGDSDNIDFQTLLNHNLLITTPEKWDSVTRRWRDNRTLASLVKLFMIDEAHLISEDHRGPTLEAVVCRMKTAQDLIVPNESNMKMRFVAVSASIPNAEDVAEWLSTPTVPARSFKFGDEMRPVKLKKVVLGYPYSSETSTPFKFDIMLSYKLQSIMLQYAEGKPTLIFCSTRKSVEMTSKQIIQNLTINLNSQQKLILQGAASTISDSKIKEMLAHGVCYHHAGLAPEDRRIVEDLFRNANLPILVTTSTLAMGVNLPAHLVIVKSTKYYANGEYQDYSESMLLQMIGRAGRPQFDTSATAVILTTLNDKKKYENLVGGEQPVESNLHKHLIEHLNAEVVLHTITDLGVAMQWLTSTFLYIRARKHPRYYGLPLGLTLEQMDKRLLDMCQIQINRLARTGMLTIDQNDIRIATTSTGLLMAKYCIAFDTMRLFTEVTGKEILQQILGLISRCHEFSEIYLRVNDKKALNLLNKCRNRETIRFPFNGRIKTVDMKINCIIQAVFGCLPIVDQSLITESQKIMRIGERISKCLAEYLETKGNCYAALLSAIILAKCFHARLWENSTFVSKQFSGIGSVLSSALVAAGKTSFKHLLEANPRDIERIVNRKAPMGNTIQDQVAHLPDYELTLEEIVSEERFSVNLRICLKNSQLLQSHASVNLRSLMILLVGDTDNNMFLYEKFTHSQLIETPQVVKKLEFPTTYEHEIKAHFLSEDWVGFDCNTCLLPSSIKKNKENVAFSTSDNKNKGPIEKNTRSNTKAGHNKEPSHIQTFMDTYFKNSKVKNQKQKQVPTSRALVKPRKSDVKETSADTPNILNALQTLDGFQNLDNNVQNCRNNPTVKKVEENFPEKQNNEMIVPQRTEEMHLSHQNSRNLESNAAPKSQMLQKLIDDSIQEYKKQNENKLPKQRDPSEYSSSTTGYYLPSSITKYTTAETNSTPSTSLVRSNDYSATIRRNLNVTEDKQSAKTNETKSFFELFRESSVNKTKPKYRFKKNMNYTVNFEDSLYDQPSEMDQSDRLSDSIILKFKYTPSKKFSYDDIASQTALKPEFVTSAHHQNNRMAELIHSQNSAIDQEETPKHDIKQFVGPTLRNDSEVSKSPENTSKSGDSFQKTLKWRSPLVTSPLVRYSPILEKDLEQLRDGKKENFSFSSLNSSDIAIASRGNKPHLKLSISVNNDSSETSTSQSEANVPRPTLRQNKFKTSSSLPLSDQAYSQSVAQSQVLNTELFSSGAKCNAPVEDPFLSTTLLENLGLVQNQADVKLIPPSKETSRFGVLNPQVKVVPRKKNNIAEAEYYSQVLLEGEEEMLKHKPEDPALKNNEDDKMRPEININSQKPQILQSNLPYQQPINITSQVADTSKQNASDVSVIDFDMDSSFIFQTFNSGTKKCETNQNSVDCTRNSNFNRNVLDFSGDHKLFASQPSREQNVHNSQSRVLRHSSFVPSYNQHSASEFDFPTSHEAQPIGRFPRVLSGNIQQNPGRKRHGRYGASKFADLQAQRRNIEYEDFRMGHCQCANYHQHGFKPTRKHLGFQQEIPSRHNFRNYHQMCSLKGATEPPYCGGRCTSYSHPRIPMADRVDQHEYFEPQASATTSHDYWDTTSDHRNAKRQKLQNHYRAPSNFRSYSFHDRDDFYTMKPDYYSQHENIPQSYMPKSNSLHQRKNPYLPSVEHGATYNPMHNRDEKQFMLQRYLSFVDENQVKQLPIRRSPNCFEQEYLDFTMCTDEADQDEEEEEDFPIN